MKCPKCHSDNPDTLKFCGECGTQITPVEEAQPLVTKTIETPREELTTGSTFARRYQIIEELGKGGMGKVYRVLDKKLNEEVALKLIKPDIASDKNTIERFKNELRLARKIRQKNVGSMYELLEDKGIHFITMEYVSGQDLKGLIRQTGQLTVGKAVSIAKQICDGLAEAHSLGVVHRDLKPSNIMIDADGNARIMDFGIARSIGAKGITGAGVMIGTPEYMSPEQVEGKEVDQRSDIYSLGVILYEMITGRVPFEGDTPLSIALKHKTETPPDPKEVNAQIPEGLSHLILRCMEKDKEKRYQRAEGLLSELTNIERGIPTKERVVPKRKPITSKEITVKFSLKKRFIPVLVIAALIIAVVVIGPLTPRKESISSSGGKPSIAVLPFDDLSPEKNQGHICEGVAESLINSLTKIRDLRVPARTSSFSFKGKEQNIEEIGRKLDVKTVLEGSVQKAGEKLRITVKLINVADESLIWSEKYDGDMEDIFAFQDKISLEILDRLRIKLLGEEKENLVKRYTENVEAYNLYVQGRWFWNKRTEEGLMKSIEYFDLAIEKDPDYALAYAGIADAYNLLPVYTSIPTKIAFPQAKEAAQKALEIDETLAEAHTSLGWIKMIWDWDWEIAEKEFKRAIELNPVYATTHHWYALNLVWRAKFDEAIKEIKQAHELDPLSLIINREVGNVYSYAGQYDQAIEALQKTIEMDPNFNMAHRTLGAVYSKNARYEEALAEYRKEQSISTAFNSNAECSIGVIYAKMDKKDKTQKVLDDLIEQSKKEYVPPQFVAVLYFALEEKDLGFEWLEKAYEDHAFGLALLKVNQEYDSVRSDPRFKVLLKKVGLEK
jgi:serine/threonine-protein kinase